MEINQYLINYSIHIAEVLFFLIILNSNIPTHTPITYSL